MIALQISFYLDSWVVEDAGITINKKITFTYYLKPILCNYTNITQNAISEIFDKTGLYSFSGKIIDKTGSWCILDCGHHFKIKKSDLFSKDNITSANYLSGLGVMLGILPVGMSNNMFVGKVINITLIDGLVGDSQVYLVTVDNE